MKKSFLALLILLFLILTVFYWLRNNNSKLPANQNVKGVTTAIKAKSNGLTLYVSSSDTWDLMQYLCASEENCVSSISSGKSLGTISGGKGENHAIYLPYSPVWKDYAFIKFYIKSGWGSNTYPFAISSTGSVADTKIYSISGFQVAVVPLKSLNNSHFDSVVFSDK